MRRHVFSAELESWLKGKQPKTFLSLDDVFQDKALAIALLLLMFIPALPLPTGGVTHVFEIIAFVLAVVLVVGSGRIWLPKKWQHKTIGPVLEGKALPFIVRRIRWFEKYSRVRWAAVLNNHIAKRILGICMMVFIVFAFFAPPFSGLDTLPALGVVCVSLSLVLEDAILTIVGLLVGIVGCTLTLVLGDAIVKGFLHLL